MGMDQYHPSLMGDFLKVNENFTLQTALHHLHAAGNR
jgi:hypothetical protein